MNLPKITPPPRRLISTTKSNHTDSVAQVEADEQHIVKIIPFIVGCAFFMQALDSTVVATALPTMAQALNAPSLNLSVAITAYLLATVACVPISGWAADRFGARRVFLGAMMVFSLSSIACALSQNLVHLISARIVQGLGGALMVPVGFIILLRTVPKHALLKALSLFSMMGLLGPMLGPLVAGFLVTYASWHWIFLINVPIGLLGIGLTCAYIQADAPQQPAPRLDWLGFFLISVCLATLMSSFEALSRQNVEPYIAGLMVVGVICAVWYVRHAHQNSAALIDLSLIRIQTFAISIVAGNLCRFSVSAIPFLLALLLQVGFGLSPFSAGLIIFAHAAGAILMRLLAPTIIHRYGFRQVLTYNTLLAASCMLIYAGFQADTPSWLMTLSLFIGGLLLSLQTTALTALTYADIAKEKTSHANTLYLVTRQLSVSLGVSVAALTLKISLMLRHSDHLSAQDITPGFIVIGLLYASAFFFFRRLPHTAGNTL